MKKNNVKKKMTDAELSKCLGRCQTLQGLGTLSGILCIIAGCVSAFIQHSTTVLAAFVFAGIALILAVALPAKKMKYTLLQRSLGDFFRTKLAEAFGAAPEIPELPIDKSFLKSSVFPEIRSAEYKAEDFCEGFCSGIHFSAANAYIERTRDERSGPGSDEWSTRSETLLSGIVLRCADICDTSLDIVLSDLRQKRADGDISEPTVFRNHFSARTSDGKNADALITPELRSFVRRTESCLGGRVIRLILGDGSLTLAVGTKYVFAKIGDDADFRDIDGIRNSFAVSLETMCGLLDIVKKSFAPSAADAE